MTRPFARALHLHLPHGLVLDGVAWPDGRCLVLEDPATGLVTGAASPDDLARGYAGARIEWAADHTTALVLSGLGHSAERDVAAVHALADCWASQPDRYAALQELTAALTAARTTSTGDTPS